LAVGSLPAKSSITPALGHYLDTRKVKTPYLISGVPLALASESVSCCGRFFDPGIADKVQAKVSANAITPQVARDFVNDLATRRALYLATLNNTIGGLEVLKVQKSSNSSGSADVAFLIPRELFKNHLGDFAKELSFINRLIQHVTEGVTGHSAPVPLEGLSSSIPTINLQATAQV
jgi:hypothetical protein